MSNQTITSLLKDAAQEKLGVRLLLEAGHSTDWGEITYFYPGTISHTCVITGNSGQLKKCTTSVPIDNIIAIQT